MSAIFYSRYDQVLDFMYYFVGTAAGVANLFHDGGIRSGHRK